MADVRILDGSLPKACSWTQASEASLAPHRPGDMAISSARTLIDGECWSLAIPLFLCWGRGGRVAASLGLSDCERVSGQHGLAPFHDLWSEKRTAKAKPKLMKSPH